MKNKFKEITIIDYGTENGAHYHAVALSYQVFGKPLGEAPVVLVVHALTGNSTVAGEEGWWSEVIGDGKVIDTQKYSVLAFDVPGNCFNEYVIDKYKNFTARDIAKIFSAGLKSLGVKELFSAIGGSIGGGIIWELAALRPTLIQNLIPIATDWKATDWMIANTLVQEAILNNSSNPIYDARMHAMNLYRTPESYKLKFNRSTNEELHVFNVESWLMHHGEKLQKRFQLTAYRMMNNLLRTVDITRGRGTMPEVVANIQSAIYIVAIDTDLFFTRKENHDDYLEMKKVKDNVYYDEIHSIHGHDAFLIEFDQLEKILSKIFK
ncbi:alpha/beta fold hydrolase [Flavobacterium sp. UBA7682]|uniref:alpha/beta fold hydrolase n=1 Tax=Flavobacterium sp. UBA7682 TaxID=1946560 RepID=UPI0025BA05C3|nr:alpha/beta fold hydrolase [Flavobacterium sp. UBA7682]